MFNSNTYGVKEYEDDDKPIKPLGLDGVPDPKPETFFRSPKILTFSLCFHF
jgi:hypothetical protein